MRMKVQGRLIQARLIEIHQVFAKKKIRSDTFLTENCSHGRWLLLIQIHSLPLSHSTVLSFYAISERQSEDFSLKITVVPSFKPKIVSQRGLSVVKFLLYLLLNIMFLHRWEDFS